MKRNASEMMRHMTTTTIAQTPTCADVEFDHMRAAKRLMLEVCMVVEGKKKLDDIFSGWSELMSKLRQVERRCLIEMEPTPEHLAAHRDAINSMIVCADSIVSVASRHLEIGYHLDEKEHAALQAQTQLVQQHREIIAFEFNGWHGPLSQEEVNGGLKALFCDSGRRAA